MGGRSPLPAGRAGRRPTLGRSLQGAQDPLVGKGQDDGRTGKVAGVRRSGWWEAYGQRRQKDGLGEELREGRRRGQPLQEARGGRREPGGGLYAVAHG